MRKKVDPTVDEAIETINMKDSPTRRRLLEGAGLVSASAAAAMARAYRVNQWLSEGSATKAITVNTPKVTTAAPSINLGRPPARDEYTQTPTAITSAAIEPTFSVPCSAMIVNNTHGTRPMSIPALLALLLAAAAGEDCDMVVSLSPADVK